MIAISTDTPTAAMTVTLVAHDDGFGFQKANGKFASLNENGEWGERDAIGGADEVFYRGANGGWIAPNRGIAVLKTFIIAAVSTT